jgi:hypothetical protein
MSDRRRIKLCINSNPAEREVETRMTLADFLRLAGAARAKRAKLMGWFSGRRLHHITL